MQHNCKNGLLPTLSNDKLLAIVERIKEQSVLYNYQWGFYYTSQKNGWTAWASQNRDPEQYIGIDNQPTLIEALEKLVRVVPDFLAQQRLDADVIILFPKAKDMELKHA